MSLDAALERLRAGRPQAALPLLESHVATQPRDAQAQFLIGVCRHQLGNAAGALEAFERALGISPDDPNVTYASAVALEELGRPDEALARYELALQRAPAHEDARHNRGLLLARLGRLDDAERSHRAYVELYPGSSRAHGDRAEALLALGRYQDAIAELDWILERSPRDALALLKRGIAFAALRRFDDSRASIGAALAADRPAVTRFIRTIAPQSEPEVMLAPENVFLWRRYVAQGACDWSGWDDYLAEFRRAIRNPALALDRALAFTALHLPLDEGERHLLARGIATRIEQKIAPLPPRSPPARGRLRIGVLSPDLREHLNAYLLLPLFELIDRRRFEIFAYSLSADDSSAIRAGVRAAADGFRDLPTLGDRDAAEVIRRDGIDLLVDAAGHTTGARFEITALRPAPLQALYLGFSSTLGSDRVDYAIVDPVVAPPGSEAHWSEALVRLPHTYYLYDFRMPTPDLAGTRADYGLPGDAVVFCASHKPEKITPDAFELWLRVLGQVPRAVLWLNSMPAVGASNLRSEAAARGVDPARLVFAPFDPRERYLARQRLGDLLLDAVHHSAMTTACDALGAGLPVLTLKGTTFASRAGESLVRAAGLPELVAGDSDAFVRMAAAIGNDRSVLAGLKDKLRANRQTAPLFDTVSRVRQLEAAFAEMWRRHPQA
ncbi:MAG TPA: tetratricopeptide repeat protein [Burkholderiales bacterium]|nr:tetratricopeptide repeat protein [Burkholderiales bacterium]